jgi:hypothetical protein
MLERVNSSKSKFFGTVACLMTGITEFSHPFDQGGQARCHLRLSSLIIDERWKQMPVRPLSENMNINQEPPSRGILPGALEGGIDVILSVAATKGLPDPIVNELVIASQTVKVPEQAGV